MSSNREQLDKWVEATLIVAKAEGMDDATVIPTWSEDLVEALPGLYPSLTVGAVRAIDQQSQTVDDSVKVPSAGKNFYGLDTDYFNKKLGLILRDMAEYTPTELARALGRLAMTASSTTMREAEFNIGKSAPDHLADEPKYIDSSFDSDSSAVSAPKPDTMAVDKCPECGSTDLQWHTRPSVRSDAPDGRLRANEVDTLFVLGCNYCSETIKTLTANEVAERLSPRALLDQDGGLTNGE